MAERELKGKGDIENDVPRRKKPLDSSDKLKATGERNESDAVGQVSAKGHANLLGDSRLSQRANTEQKVELLSSLQRSHGNAYVQRLLAGTVQAKLTVNPPDDQYEKEADRVGESVAKSAGSQLQRQEEEEELQMKRPDSLQRQEEEEEELMMKRSDSLQRQEEEEEELQMKRDSLQRQEEEEEEEMLQTKSVEDQVPIVSDGLDARINASRGSGESLPDSIRTSVEPKLGHDFSDVRVHNDSEADSLSGRLGARAFTTGSDIFFRSGQYEPDSEEGKKLLGHEMTHVVQQGGAPVSRKADEPEEESSPASREEAIVELRKSRDRAMSDMSAATTGALIQQVARCRELGADDAARDALDKALGNAAAIVKNKANVLDIETSSLKMAKDLYDQIAVMQDGVGSDADMMDRLQGLAQDQLGGATSQLQQSPSDGAAAQNALEKAATVHLLGGDASAGIAALQRWAIESSKKEEEAVEAG